MVVTVAVLPWPPAFVPELMGRAASEVEPLRHAADSALRGLVAELRRHADGQVVVVAPGEPGEHEAPARSASAASAVTCGSPRCRVPWERSTPSCRPR